MKAIPHVPADLSDSLRSQLARLTEGNLIRCGRTQVSALVRRELAQDAGNGWARLTDAGLAARDAVQNPRVAVPGKVLPFLRLANELGLVWWQGSGEGTGLRAWYIDTPDPDDRTSVWLYWFPGPSGGQLDITLYFGPGAKLTEAKRAQAVSVLKAMGKRWADLQAGKGGTDARQPE